MTRLARPLPALSLLIASLINVIALCPHSGFAQEENYPIPPEAEKQEGVPEGKVHGPFELHSMVYPGTVREYWVYVPDQYNQEKPACTLIVQDGIGRARGWRIPQICDNLIHAEEMPVTIGIFVSPGVVRPPESGGSSAVAEATDDDASEDSKVELVAQPRFNRSFEYDSLGDRYARFLLQELLPEVGKTYNLSTNPNDRALAGSSSGGVCAFNAAWERPDAFRRVISTVGTFVGLRGGNELSAQVRKFEPKPLRIFLQDGSNDLNIYAGDWWTANQDMLSALKWAGYDVHHIWGEGGHNAKHSAAIMPEALRWIWRDYPEPIKGASNAEGKRRVDLLIKDAAWQEVSSGHELAEAATCNAEGEVFFSDSKTGRVYRIGHDGKTRIFADQTGRISSLAFGADGLLYGIRDQQQVVQFLADGKSKVLHEHVGATSIVTLPAGFFVASKEGPSLNWYAYPNPAAKTTNLQPVVQPFPMEVVSMTPTSDHAFLHLVGNSQLTQHLLLGAGGTVTARQPYGYLEMPYATGTSGASGSVIDQENRLFVASPVGVQVLDQLGRVNFIILPPNREPITGITFGSIAKDYIFVTTSKSVYKRKLNTRGALSFGQPTSPPKPRL